MSPSRRHPTPSPCSGESDDDAPLVGPPVPEGHVAPPETPERSSCGAGCCGHGEPVDRCSFHVDDNGRFHLTLETDRVRGEIIEQALVEARDALFNDGQVDVTWVDAFGEICERSLDAVASPERRNRFRINMHLDVDGRFSNATGHFLPDAIRRYLTCDGLVSPVLVENGIPISVGRSQHIVPDRTRRVVIHRDGGCGVPGCGASKFLEVHHIIHWEHGGVTESWNLIALCPHHHRLHHQGRLGISGNADIPGGVVFTDGNGKQILASGARPKPPGAPPSPPIGRYQHPLGERLDLSMVHFSPPIDRRQRWPRPAEHPSCDERDVHPSVRSLIARWSGGHGSEHSEAHHSDGRRRPRRRNERPAPRRRVRDRRAGGVRTPSPHRCSRLPRR